MNLEPVLNSNGELYKDWALLFEEMPDRFVIGSDAKFMRKGFTYILCCGSIHPDTCLLVTKNVR